MRVTVERVGEGILCTFRDPCGARPPWTLYFEDRVKAADFGAQLVLVARYGEDSLDYPPAAAAPSTPPESPGDTP